MKKLLILSVLFSTLFLAGCANYYSQAQVDKMIQDQAAADQVQLVAIQQQLGSLEEQVSELTRGLTGVAADQVGQDLPAASSSQPGTPAAAVNEQAAAPVPIDQTTKDWLTFNDKNLNYTFKYPKGFFEWTPIAKNFDCDTELFTSDQVCPIIPDGFIPTEYPTAYIGGKSGQKDNKFLGGHQFCTRGASEAGMSQLYSSYFYININGNKCSMLGFVIHTTNGCGMYNPGPEMDNCEKRNAIEIPQTLSKIESTFSFK